MGLSVCTLQSHLFGLVYRWVCQSVHFSLTFLAWFIDGFVSLYKSDEVASQHLHLGGGEDVRLVDEHLISARGGRHLESVALTLTCPQNKVHWTVRYEGPCLVGHSKSTL